MRRALTILTLPILLLSAWDCVPKARAGLRLWSRLRQRHGDAPDTGWDAIYRQLTPYLPARGRIGLVQAAAPDSPIWARQYYYLQYSLAPRVIVPGAREEFVVAYGPPAAWPSLIDPSSFSLVRSFEDGFALYRRTAR